MTSLSDKNHKPIRTSTLAAYSLSAAPINAFTAVLMVYLPAFYAGHMKINIGVIGLIFMVMRFWDVVTDPIMGYISDRYSSRWGRRRHWMVISVPVLLICMYFLFIPIEGVGAVYLSFWLFVSYIGYTLLLVSHNAWAAELTYDYDERSRLLGWRELAGMVGMIAIVLAPALLDTVATVSEADRMALMAWVLIIALPICVGITVWKTPEFTNQTNDTVPFLQGVRLLMKNKTLRHLLAIDLMNGLGPGFLTATFMFYVKFYLDLGALGNAGFLLFLLFSMFSIPVWIKMNVRFGKHKTLAMAFALFAVFMPLSLLIPKGEAAPYLVLSVLWGCANGGLNFSVKSMVADIIDMDYLESGQRRSGVFFALFGLTSKAGYALAIGISYMLLDAFGFSAKLENSESAITALGWICFLCPAVCFATGAVLSWKYPLGKKEQRQFINTPPS